MNEYMKIKTKVELLKTIKTEVYELMGAVLFFFVFFYVNIASYAALDTQQDRTIEERIVSTDDAVYTYDEMGEDIWLLVNRYPDKIRYEIAGTSVDGRYIFAVTLGNPDAAKSVFVEAGTHGREYMNCMLVMAQLEEYLLRWDEQYRNGLTFGEVLSRCNLVVMPMVNPDGVTISQFGIDGIRSEEVRNNLINMDGILKYTRWKANANGVDPNRQYNCYWNTVINSLVPTSGGQEDPYNGLLPETEPEVVAVEQIINNKEQWMAAISFHSSEEAVYYDMGEAALDDVALACGELAMHCGNLTGYRVGELNGESSVPRGLLYNWLIINKNIRTVLIETGRDMCPLPYRQWAKIWVSNWEVPIFAAMTYGYL